MTSAPGEAGPSAEEGAGIVEDASSQDISPSVPHG